MARPPASSARSQRTKSWRAPAYQYRNLVIGLRDQGVTTTDQARGYDPVVLSLAQGIVPREHQAKALRAWVEGGRRGVVQLPTGAGKTYLALLALVQTQRPALVVVPTIDLLASFGVQNVEALPDYARIHAELDKAAIGAEDATVAASEQS